VNWSFHGFISIIVIIGARIVAGQTVEQQAKSQQV
jgi:hypothetical protein